MESKPVGSIPLWQVPALTPLMTDYKLYDETNPLITDLLLVLVFIMAIEAN